MDPNNQVPEQPQDAPETVDSVQAAPQPEVSSPVYEAPQPAQYEAPAPVVAPTATPVSAPLNAPALGAEDPGHTMAIIGIVLAFFFTIAGLVVSIIARKKSIAAGFDGSLAKVGIILNSIFLVLGAIIFIGIMALITMSATTGIQEKAATNNINTLQN